MAIAAIVIYAQPEKISGLLAALAQNPDILDCRQAAPGRIAATLEVPADKLLTALGQVRKMQNVLNVDLAYVNYEDDLDENGKIPCPPLADLKRQMRSHD